MIPVTQTKVNVKNSNGDTVVYGNCFAAVIASMLELPITEVPNVEVFFHMSHPHWSFIMDTFLKSKGWELWGDDRYRCFHTGLITDQDEMDKAQELCEQLKDSYYLASGLSARGVHHICIYQNGQLVWDPHPSREGLKTIDTFQTLEKIT